MFISPEKTFTNFAFLWYAESILPKPVGSLLTAAHVSTITAANKEMKLYSREEEPYGDLQV